MIPNAFDKFVVWLCCIQSEGSRPQFSQILKNNSGYYRSTMTIWNRSVFVTDVYRYQHPFLCCLVIACGTNHYGKSVELGKFSRSVAPYPKLKTTFFLSQNNNDKNRFRAINFLSQLQTTSATYSNLIAYVIDFPRSKNKLRVNVENSKRTATL